MKKIKYKVAREGLLSECLTPCPKGMKAMVGSWGCRVCKYNVLDSGSYVVCTHGNISNRIKRLFKKEEELI